MSNAGSDRPATIAGVLAQQCRTRPDAPALLAADQEPLTYRGLAGLAELVGQTLTGANIAAEARVAIAMANGPELAALIVGVASHATALPLNPTLTPAEAGSLLRDMRATVLIAPTDLATPARDAAKDAGLRVLELRPDLDAPAGTFTLSGAGDKTGGRRAPTRDDIAIMLPTSGTTAKPKRFR